MSKRPPTIHQDQLDWAHPEGAPDPLGLAAEAQGYAMEIAPSVDRSKTWDWICRRGTQRIGFGEARSPSGAKRAAANAANHDARARASKPSAGAVLQALDASLGGADPKPRRRKAKATA